MYLEARGHYTGSAESCPVLCEAHGAAFALKVTDDVADHGGNGPLGAGLHAFQDRARCIWSATTNCARQGSHFLKRPLTHLVLVGARHAARLGDSGQGYELDRGVCGTPRQRLSSGWGKLPADRGDVAQQRLFDRTIFERST